MNLHKYTKEEFSQHAKKYLSKGIKQPRFRASQNNFVFPVLYAICYTKNLKLSELAEILNVNKNQPRRWIRGQYLPSEENINKLTDLFMISESILFISPIKPIIKLKISSNNYKSRRLKFVKYPILYGLINIYGYTIKEFCDTFNFNVNTMHGYFYSGKKPNIDNLCKLGNIFGIDYRILFYKPLN